MADFDSPLGDFDYQPSLFDDWTAPAVLFDDGYGLFDSALNNFDDGGINSATVSITGITLTAEAGSITQNVSDEIQITGLQTAITAENIAATGIQNANISLTGLELSAFYGDINEIVNDSVSISGLEALANVATISASATQSQSIALSGIDLVAEYGEINEQVVDSIALDGIDLAINAEEIAATGTINTEISINGIGLQGSAASISATGEQTSTDIATGGEFVRPRMERSAKALVQSTRAVAYAGRVTPRGFTVINGGARVFTLESYTQIGQTEAVGQLGIDEESLLMLLVA
jgi:hypothetical protein